jgi:uncharacterized membrane protein
MLLVKVSVYGPGLSFTVVGDWEYLYYIARRSSSFCARLYVWLSLLSVTLRYSKVPCFDKS